MKQVTAVFRPIRLEAIEQAFHALPHLPGFTILPARGHPRGHGPDHRYVADDWDFDGHQHLVLLAFCSDEVVEELVQAISTAAYTGVPGDGVVAVSSLTEALRIRTGERGDAAL